MRRTWLIATWIGATALVSWVTFQALASAQDGVGEATLPPAVVSASDSSRGSAGTSFRQPTSTSTSGTSTIPAAGEASTGPAGQEPSDDPAPAPTTTSTAPSPSSTPTTVTTTSTVAAAWQTRVVESGGGTVTVRFRPGEVQYQAAVPAPGYRVEIDETSPEVRVEFVGGDAEWDVRIRWNNGGLDIDVSD